MGLISWCVCPWQAFPALRNIALYLILLGVWVNQRERFPLRSAFCFPTPNYTFRVEPAGGERKSADVEQKTVTLIYPYPLIRPIHKLLRK
jgi:hypothetical protein